MLPATYIEEEIKDDRSNEDRYDLFFYSFLSWPHGEFVFSFPNLNRYPLKTGRFWGGNGSGNHIQGGWGEGGVEFENLTTGINK